MASNPLIQGNTVNIPVGSGNLQINLGNGTATLSGGGASVSGNLTKESFTLSAGAASVTFNSNGNDSVTVKTGLVSSTIDFTPTGGTSSEVTGLEVSADAKLLGIGASASIDISKDSSGTWQGSVSGGTNTGISVLDNFTKFDKSFDPTITDPCTIVPGGFGTICSRLESSASQGTINLDEQQQLNETSLVDPTSLSQDTLLANTDSAGISFDISSGLYGSTGIAGMTGFTGITGFTGGGGFTGVTVASARFGYAARSRTESTRGPGLNVATISALEHSPVAATTGKNLTVADLANSIDKAVHQAGPQNYSAVGSTDGVTLVGTGGTLVNIDADLTGNVASHTANGGKYETFNSSGLVQSAVVTGTGETMAFSNAALTVQDSTTTTLTGSANQVSLGANDAINVVTPQKTLMNTLTLTGSGDTVTTEERTSAGGTIAGGNVNASIVSNASATFNEGGGIVHAGVNDSLQFTGFDPTVVGNSDAITYNPSLANTFIVVYGSNDTIHASNVTVELEGPTAASTTSDTVVGTGDKILHLVVAKPPAIAAQIISQGSAMFDPPASVAGQAFVHAEHRFGALIASGLIHHAHS